MTFHSLTPALEMLAHEFSKSWGENRLLPVPLVYDRLGWQPPDYPGPGLPCGRAVQQQFVPKTELGHALGGGSYPWQCVPVPHSEGHHPALRARGARGDALVVPAVGGRDAAEPQGAVGKQQHPGVHKLQGLHHRPFGEDPVDAGLRIPFCSARKAQVSPRRSCDLLSLLLHDDGRCCDDLQLHIQRVGACWVCGRACVEAPVVNCDVLDH